MPRICIAAIMGLAAIVDDVSRRRISNWIPVAALVAGLVLQFTERRWWGVLEGLEGAATGSAVFLVFYLLGGMGGGDIKLMAGFGAVLGVKSVLVASLWTAACGGVMAVVVIFAAALKAWWAARRTGGVANSQNGIQRPTQVESIPYAPAIAAGVWLTLIGSA